MHDTATLTIIDYVVFCGTIVVSFLVGIFTVGKAKASADDFLTGGRSLSPTAVGCSLVTSFVSSISLLGMSGETYTYGIQLYIFMIGSLFGIYATTFISLPVLSALHLTSTNEYLELRFHSNGLRIFVSIVSIIKKIIYMGICLYAPTIALAAVTSLNVDIYIVILGVVCTTYSAIGGIRAVIWTDVFQMIVMIIGMAAVVIIGIWKIGLGQIWSIGTAGGRTQLFDMRINPFIRCTFWHAFIFGFTISIALFGVDQLNMQRISAVATEKDSRKVLLITAIGMVIVYTFIYGSGLIVYAYYAGCDPMTLGYITKREETLPYFVMDNLSFIYGLPGLFVAALFCGSLSSISSAINGVVAMLWKDVFEKFAIFSTMTPRMSYVVNSAISMVVGLIMIGMAFISSKAESIIAFSYSMSSIFAGPSFGVFLLGLLMPRCNATGAWSGFVVSLSVVTWMSVGSQLFAIPPPNLPLSIDMCNVTFNDASNSTNISLDPVFYDVLNQSVWENVTSVPYTVITNPVTDSADDTYVFPLYTVSYLLYTFIGTMICIIVALLVTLFWSSQKVTDVPLHLISPFMRRFYKKANVIELEENPTVRKSYKTVATTELQENPTPQSSIS